MATVSGTLKMFDAMTGPLKKITQSMNIMISTMQEMQNVTERNTRIDRQLEAAKRQITQAEVELKRGIEGSNRAQINFNDSVNKTRFSMTNLAASVFTIQEGVELLRSAWEGFSNAMTISDEVTGANTRLALVNDGLLKQQELQEKVLDVANRTRSPYIETAGLVSKLGAGTQGLFKNNQQILDFAERFNKTLVIGGATATDTSSAILQMGQALGSGVLNGDELRALSEASPVLMRVLADGLGVARGELKAMGADGQLTSEKIVEAFRKQSDEINKMFDSMQMTFGGAMTIMKNEFITWYATLAQGEGPLTLLTAKVQQFTSFLQSANGQQFFTNLAFGIANVVGFLIQMVTIASQVYMFFSSNWSTIGPIILGIVAAMTAFKLGALGVAAAQGIMALATGTGTVAIFLQTLATQGLSAAWRTLNAAMKANIFIFIISVIIGVITWIVNLWKTNDQFAAALFRIWNAILNFFDMVPAFFWTVVEAIAKSYVWLADKIGFIYDTVINTIIAGINKVLQLVNEITGSAYQIQAEFSFEKLANSALEYAGAKKNAAYAEAAAKAAEREQKVQDMLANRQEARAAKESKMSGQTGAGVMGGGGTSLFDPNPSKTSSLDKVNKVGEVGKIKDKVDISSEDLKVMRELAEMKNIQNFVTLQPSIQLSGDNHFSNGYDVDTVIERIDQYLQTELASNVSGVYGVG